MNRTTPPARRDPLIEALDALERAAAMQALLLKQQINHRQQQP